MDDVRIGLVFRTVRRRLGWRQVDVAERARVDQSLVSLIETGRLDRLTVRSVRAVAAALQIGLPFEARWRGANLAQLLDERHATMVEAVLRVLHVAGWQTIVEYTFSHFGERGSVDIVAWHSATRATVLIEVKTRLVDVQELLAAQGRRLRVVPPILARERGWRAATVGCLVVLPDTSASRRRVAMYAETFAAAAPARSHEVKAWLRHPAGSLRGIWFLSAMNQHHAKQRTVGIQRVRQRRAG